MSEGDQKVRVMLVDDHALFRVGMRQILEREPDFDIIGEADRLGQGAQSGFDRNVGVVEGKKESEAGVVL